MKNVWIVLALLAAFSCSVPLTEEVVETHLDGSPKLIVFWKPSGDTLVPHMERSLYPDGKIKIEGKLNELGKRHGTWQAFFPSGSPWSEGTFTDGKPNGKRTVWYENGQKRYEGAFTSGTKSGTWTYWDESGNLIREEQL